MIYPEFDPKKHTVGAFNSGKTRAMLEANRLWFLVHPGATVAVVLPDESSPDGIRTVICNTFEEVGQALRREE